MKILVLLSLALTLACTPPYRPPMPVPPPPPPVVVVPPVEPEPPTEPAKPIWATGAQLVDYRGNLANLRDSRGWTIWTPSLPGATDEVWDEWMAILKANGTTHIPVGPFEGGPIYPGSPFANRDLSRDQVELRKLIVRILDTPAADGLGMRPVIFLSGGALRREWVDMQFPLYAQALAGLEPHVILVPAWEPVVGDATTAELAYAYTEGRRLFGPNATWFWHGSPRRGTWSSNPVEPDDPFRFQGPTGEWETCEACAFQGDFAFISGVLYQTDHGRELYLDPCTVDMGDACWIDRWHDMVIRHGAGQRGWRRVTTLVLFETIAYEFFRNRPEATLEVARRIATDGLRVCQAAGVDCKFGNGLPTE